MWLCVGLAVQTASRVREGIIAACPHVAEVLVHVYSDEVVSLTPLRAQADIQVRTARCYLPFPPLLLS